MEEKRTLVQWNWRRHFLSWNLEKGKEILKNHPFEVEKIGRSYSAVVDGFQVKSVGDFPISFEELKKANGKNQNLSSYVFCECKRDFGKCPHVAAFLMGWEEQYDSDGEKKAAEEEKEEREIRMDYEAVKMLPQGYSDENQYFLLEKALAPYKSEGAEYRYAEELLSHGCYLELEEYTLQLKAGEQFLHFSGKPVYDDGELIDEDCTVDALLGSTSFLSLSCTCLRFQRLSAKGSDKEKKVCFHILMGIRAMGEYLLCNHPEEDTDERGMNMMTLLYEEDTKRSVSRGKKKKHYVMSIVPCLMVGESELRLSFKITTSREKGRLFALPDILKLVPAVEEKTEMSFEGGLCLDMEQYCLDTEGLFWFGVIRRLVTYYNKKLAEFVESREGEFTQLKDTVYLEGEWLDLVYEACEGHSLPCELDAAMEEKARREQEERLRREELKKNREAARDSSLEPAKEASPEIDAARREAAGEKTGPAEAEAGVIEAALEGEELPADLEGPKSGPSMGGSEPEAVREEGQTGLAQTGLAQISPAQTEPAQISPVLKEGEIEDFGTEDAFSGMRGLQKAGTEEKREPQRSVEVGTYPLEVNICLSPKLSSKGNLMGISMTGEMPSLYQGSLHRYFLKDGHLSVVRGEDLQRLGLLEKMSQNSGSLDCYIGKNQFQAFYYRALPVLATNPLVRLEDHCQEIGRGKIPLPLKLSFYLDRVRGMDTFTCKIKVKYGKISFWYPRSSGEEEIGQRDEMSEQEAVKKVEGYFPLALETSKGTEWYKEAYSSEEIYEIYEEAVPALRRLGSILVTDDFSSRKVKSFTNSKLQLQMSSGLLSVGFTNPDEIDVMQLSQIYESYRLKRKYHRMQDGSLVDLENAQILEDLYQVSEQIQLSLEDMLGGKAMIPLYRTLYLEQLMSERELPYTSDEMVTQLVKRFDGLGSKEYPVPPMGEALLRPYQVFGYRWLRAIGESGFGGILADDMGLGKTLQVLTLLNAWKAEGKEGPSLVVCPASLVYNWKAEAERFAPDLQVKAVDGTLAQRRPFLLAMQEDTETDLYLVSYDMVRRDVAYYQKLSFQCVILDEAQYIKNESTATAKAVKSIRSLHRYALTGTPIENRLLELWSIFDFLMPGFLYTAKEFHRSFELPIMKYGRQDRARELSRLVGPFILRRLKGDVLKDLPEKLEETRSARMEGEQARLYDAQVLHIQELLTQDSVYPRDKMKVLTEIMRLRQVCCDPSLVYENYRGGSAKRELCHELIRMAIEGGHRVLLFSQYVSMLSLLEKDLQEKEIPYLLLTGATPKETRLELVKEFNEGDIPVFMISLKAGGTGLNLTGADVVIHYDPWWNVSAQNQATDRSHRIGQTRVVTVYKLILDGSIEEKIVGLQKSKKDLADSILDVNSSNILTMSQEDLMELLRRDEA